MSWKNRVKKEIAKIMRFNKNKKHHKQEEVNSNANDGLDYLNRACEILQELGIIESKQQFSEQFLGKSKFYYGVLDCEKRKVGIHLLHDLTQNLKQIKECFESDKLNQLISEGQQILRKRVEKYYNM